jgi:restriction system protein
LTLVATITPKQWEQSMGRRKNSAADDFVELISLMPWWVGVIAALVSYIVFHKVAGMAPGKMLTPADVGAAMQRTVFAGIASAAQYLVPFLCLVGSLTSYLGRRKRRELVSTVAASPDASALNGIFWREFELLVGEAFRLRGYTVDEIGGSAPDGGVDLVLHKAGHTFLVQCKQWRTAVVDVKVVRELYGVIAARKAAGGFVVTSGRFTSAAKDFAKGKWLYLVDGEELHKMIVGVRAARGAAILQASPEPVPTSDQAPECPACSSRMVLRTAQKGATAGSRFWGCSRFPSCRGTRPS